MNMEKKEHQSKADCVRINMDISVELPNEMANEIERLGIYCFDHCTYDDDAHRMIASVSTTLYRLKKSA